MYLSVSLCICLSFCLLPVEVESVVREEGEGELETGVEEEVEEINNPNRPHPIEV